MRLFLMHGTEPAALALARQVRFPHGTTWTEECQESAIITFQWNGRFDRRCLVFQCPQVVDELTCKEYCQKVLSVNGVQSVLSGSVIKRNSSLGHVSANYRYSLTKYHTVYRMLVFQLDILDIQVKRSSHWVCSEITSCLDTPSWERIQVHHMTRQARQVKREAVKAIYVLGLDYGEVNCAVNSNGEVVVIEVTPLTIWTEENIALLAEAMNRLADSLALLDFPQDDIWLGADPEFLLLHPRGKVVPASRFFQREGVVGCDSLGSQRYRNLRPLAELRPRPSPDVRRLTAHVRQTMIVASRQINDESLAWLSGGMPLKGFALGGHLHFSHIWLNVQLLRALDNYVALPLMLIEGDSAKARRPRYGALGDFRRKSHGGFEYRTLSSWLVSPTVTRAVFALAQFVAKHHNHLLQKPLQELTNQIAFYEANRTHLLPVVLQHIKEIRNFPTYPQVENDIQPLFKLIEQQFRCDEQADIRLCWKLTER